MEGIRSSAHSRDATEQAPSVGLQAGSFRRSRLFITSIISAGTGSSWILGRPVEMWCKSCLEECIC